jgi:hypothetical protein
MKHTTLRERMEQRERVKQVIRQTGQFLGYSLAGASVAVMIYVSMIALLVG